MATTFAHLMLSAEEQNETISTFGHKIVPAGHFIAITYVNDMKIIYLLEGERDDLDSLVKGHVVLSWEDGSSLTKGYKGDSQTGKFNPFNSRSYLGQDESFEFYFTKMV